MPRVIRSQIGKHRSSLSRAESAGAVQALLAEGASCQEVCAALGISHSYFYALKNDPEGVRDKARKDRNRGTCTVCGGPTTGSDGRNHAPTLCWHCAPREQQALWSPELVIFALQEVRRLTGEVPKAAVALGGGYKQLDVQVPGSLGALVNTAQRYFGSWNEAIAAAGMTPRRTGMREFHARLK